jgi:hypothetical protein
MKYVMMRFYGGGGLARHETIECEEEVLVDHLAEFEQDCANSNEGEYLGVLDEKEFKSIMKDMKDE